MSSAYATATSGTVVPEVLADLPFDPLEWIKDIEKMTDKEVEGCTTAWLGK
jgi:hypothetical protein